MENNNILFNKPTQKDYDRADGLYWHGKSFGHNLVLGNASKMAKSIKDTEKILRRLVAVYERWGDDAALPFAARAAELMPDSVYAKAWREGIDYGRTGMNAAYRCGYSDSAADLIFVLAVRSGGRLH